ncbi:MAG: fructose-bisphosphatase class III [Erysipelotrichaceae bacterium]|nr:fructose-bisphosphatase class III [Erysipelotrichaceae bacterium]
MIYIMSDMHGQYKRYKAMLEKIQLKDDDKLYILGDAIDRGPGSLEILFDIMDRDNVEMFLGNHEHMMLTYLEGSDRMSWFYGVNGGSETYKRFKECSKETQKKIVDFLLYNTTIKKDLYLGDKRYILSHTSALNDGVDIYTKDHVNNLMGIQDIMWNMTYQNIESIQDLPQTDKETYFISGHIITMRLSGTDEVFIQHYPNGYSWYDIDCGCAMGSYYGALSCLKIDENGNILDIYYVR